MDHIPSYIPRKGNVPSVPQLRPIELFWFQFKQKLYENGWEAEIKTDYVLGSRANFEITEFHTSARF